MLDAAAHYATLGYPVFPCAPGQKTPLTAHGVNDATTEPERIAQWWARWPAANVAIRTDGLLVVDVDGEDNHWLADDPQKLVELAAAPSAVTPRGGRHYLFRAPPGQSLRNSAGVIAPRVDTRASGGYIVVAPSTVGDRGYRWANRDELLDVPPDQLPEPPRWLLAMLDRRPATPGVSGGANQIPEGQRNGTLARLGGVMRRSGMSQSEILAALVRANTDRCVPPLPVVEVERIATSIARYEPDAVATALAENHWDQLASAEPSRAVSLRELMSTYRMLRPPVIYGLLRRGETMNVIAPPKTGKSWLVLGLSMSVATGRAWLGSHDTVAGHVLIVDNELHPETLAHRVPQVAEALRINLTEIAETIHVQSVRGRLRDIFSLEQYLVDQSVRYTMVVLDAFYRFMPRGMDENDNATMAGIYNHIDSLADRLGCCFVLVHHTSKGNQAAKSVTDVGAGAGSQSRAADTHLVLRAHQEPGVVVLDAAARSWPPVPARCLRWTFPAWTPADELDPAELRSERPGRARGGGDGLSLDAFVSAAVASEPAARAEIHARVPDMSARRIAAMLERAVGRGLVHRWRVGQSHRVLYATVPQPLPGTS